MRIDLNLDNIFYFSGVWQSQIRKKKRKPQIQNLCEKWENKLFEQKKIIWKNINGQFVEGEERQITIGRFYFPESFE